MIWIHGFKRPGLDPDHWKNQTNCQPCCCVAGPVALYRDGAGGPGRAGARSLGPDRRRDEDTEKQTSVYCLGPILLDEHWS